MLLDKLVLVSRSVAQLGSSKPENGMSDKTFFRINLEKMHQHPLYKKVSTRGAIYFDVAVVVLQTPVAFSDNIRPICLPARPTDALEHLTGQLVTLAGWGKYFINATTDVVSSELKFINLKVTA